MSDHPMTGDRFERDLREVLAELAPAAAPDRLREAVQRVPSAPPAGRRAGWAPMRSWPARLVAATVALALVAVLVVAIGHPFGLGRFDNVVGPGGPTTPPTSPTPCAMFGFPARVEYQLLAANGIEPDAGIAMEVASIASARLRAMGVDAPNVQVLGADRIALLISACDGDRADLLRQVVGTTGRLDFVPLGQTPAEDGQQLPDATLATACSTTVTVDCVLFSGDQVASASIGVDQTAQRTVDFVLGDTGRTLFGSYTADHVGDYFAIVLDGKVISAPVINEPIPGGQVQISQAGVGGFTLDAAQTLIAVIESGPLPLPLQEVAGRTDGSASPPMTQPSPSGTDEPVPALTVDNPTLTVTPSTSLHDGQVVVVRVTGFGVGGKVRLSECGSPEAATDLGCGLDLAAQPMLVTGADRSGQAGFTVTSDARAGLLPTDPMVRCQDQCVIVATLGAGFPYLTAPISFAAP